MSIDKFTQTLVKAPIRTLITEEEQLSLKEVEIPII